MRIIMELADRANPFVEHATPWLLNKDPSKREQLQEVCTIALNLFRQLAVYLAPVLPRLAKQCGELLNDPIESWDQSKSPLLGSKVSAFSHMLQRVKKEDIEKMIEDSKPAEGSGEVPSAAVPSSANIAKDSGEALEKEPLAPMCTIDDFTKVDLRVARVIAADEVPEARKLLKLTVSMGGDATRAVFAGIKAAYKPEDLIGRLVIIVANLQPRQMKFGLSEGMVTAAGEGGAEVFLLSPDSGAKPGQRVH
jgi:methionyl-tRNA synthetase